MLLYIAVDIREIDGSSFMASRIMLEDVVLGHLVLTLFLKQVSRDSFGMLSINHKMDLAFNACPHCCRNDYGSHFVADTTKIGRVFRLDLLQEMIFFLITRNSITTSNKRGWSASKFNNMDIQIIALWSQHSKFSRTTVIAIILDWIRVLDSTDFKASHIRCPQVLNNIVNVTGVVPEKNPQMMFLIIQILPVHFMVYAKHTKRASEYNPYLFQEQVRTLNTTSSNILLQELNLSKLYLTTSTT
ncbi:hypothetical protein ACJX0J_008175 [Zea mays]